MSNLLKYPLEDGYESTLAQAWDGQVGTITVNASPSFTFPSWVTTYIVVDPGKTTMQIGEINAYDAGLKTITVSNITLEKGAGINSTAVNHTVWAKVIISDNYQFWKDILDAINSKIDTEDAQHAVYADDAARDAVITSPSNWMEVYNTTDWAFNDYIGWAWVIRATGAVVNASTTVAGKVEIATDAEITAGTGTGWTGAILSVTPTQANTLVNLATTDTTSSDTDFYMFEDAAASNINKKITQANLRESLAASETVKGTAERATNAEALAWVDTTRYITSAQMKTETDLLKESSFARATQDISSTTTLNIAHGLWKVPILVEITWWVWNTSTSEWSYDGTNDECTALITTTIQNRTDRSIILSNSTWFSTSLQWNITVDGTNVIIAWTKAWSPTWTWYIRIKTT